MCMLGAYGTPRPSSCAKSAITESHDPAIKKWQEDKSSAQHNGTIIAYRSYARDQIAIDTTPAGKDWLAGKSAVWKVYNTAELNEVNMHKLLNSGILPRPIALVSTISNLRDIENLAPYSASGGLRDTAANSKNKKGFTVNMVSASKASCLKESAISVECELYKCNINHPVTDVLTDRGIIDIMKFKPTVRLGDVSYGHVGDAFRMVPPKWEQEEVKVEDTLATLSLL
ncbi:hypothetical protein BD769DRAFT_1646466 [Suillus cothurnatus]|nr:hypothetical protein BD769DRAFT_1646466 [Suillus cothurnatus]